MTAAQTRSLVDRAKLIYDERLRSALEPDHAGRYVAVEPDSGDHFLADSFDGAVRAARTAHPTRLAHVMRVGHPAALHHGGGHGRVDVGV